MKKILTTILAALPLMAMALPTVTTREYIASGSTRAFARINIVANGSTLKESGICWSADSKTPTVDDNKSRQYYSNNGAIYRMENLTPATEYHCRAYTITSTGETVYGNAVRFYTHPYGNVTWGYEGNGPDQATNDRITNAVRGCADYWNALGNVSVYLSVHFGSGTPTADCSYGGWMRVGPNTSYQQTGTIMHEALHAIGVGTHWYWNDNADLREAVSRGAWKGDRTNDLLRFWDNDPAATLQGDATHLWPYGINGAHEDNQSDMLYTINGLIAQAVGEDGLPCNSGRPTGNPHYSLKHEDGVKYYIKSESYNTTTHFLYETSMHKLRYAKKTAEQAVADDAYAWYITYNPKTEKYLFRNAKTGYYISYGSSSFSCTTAEGSGLQLNRSRIDDKQTGCRGYWMLDTSSGMALKQSGTDSNTEAYAFGNSATAQRFLILTQEEMVQMEAYILNEAREAYQRAKEEAMKVYDTPHMELTAGADATFLAALAAADEKMAVATTKTAMTTQTTAITTALKALMKGTCVTDITKPYDVTYFFVKNPHFTNGVDEWTTEGATCAEGEVEYYQKAFTISQKLPTLTKGTYEVRMQAFQRPGAYSTAYSDYKNGKDNADATLSIGKTTDMKTVKIRHIAEEATAKAVHADDKAAATGAYVPNTMVSAQARFAAGQYDNSVQYYIAAGDAPTITVKSEKNSDGSYWTVIDNCRLLYYGGLTMDEIKAKAGALQVGDANADGVTDLKDADTIGAYYTGTKASIDKRLADVNNDGKVTVADANAVINVTVK